MTIISLEGNIGSGKSEFIQFFKKYFNDEIIFVEDNVYNWKDKKLLSNFYKEPDRWSFAIQIKSISLKFKRFLNVLPHCKSNSLIISHRSPMSDKYCFKKACVDNKYMDDKEDEIYNCVFDNYRIPKYSGIIYLKSNVNKCYENIINKNDKIEKNISFDFLMSINKNYEEWISKLNKDNIPVVEINAEEFRDLDSNEMLQNRLYYKITDKFPQLIEFSKKR